MTSKSTETTRFVVRSIATTAVENEQYFGELDAVVGDGDFGFSLARGFEKVLESSTGTPPTRPPPCCRRSR
jgi:dihydroxyacetone kinase-like protein